MSSPPFGRPPGAVLFDYGGVLGEVDKPEGGLAEVADHLAARLSRLGVAVTAAELAVDLGLGLAGYEGLKRAQSRQREPREITHAEFWELISCDWPAPARAFVRAEATPLTARFEAALLRRPARDDAAATLDALRAAGVRTALVCNCLSGSVGRDELLRDGLLDRLDVALFSDEVGLRKPGPGLLRVALDALDRPAEQAWFVGDRIDRDILAARRAGVAAAILMRARGGPGAALRGVEPDVRIDRLGELLGLAGLASAA